MIWRTTEKGKESERRLKEKEKEKNCRIRTGQRAEMWRMDGGNAWLVVAVWSTRGLSDPDTRQDR